MGGMKSVQMLVLVAAATVGMNVILPDAAAELPKPGAYKGTLTVVRVTSGRMVGDPDVTTKQTFQVVARIDSTNYARIAYKGGLEPLLGLFVETAGNVQLAVGGEAFPTQVMGSRLSFSNSVSGNVLGPGDESVLQVIQYTTKLTRVGK